MRVTTPVEIAGPVERTWTQYCAGKPTGGTLGAMKNSTPRSALRFGVTAADAVLLVGLGSGSLPLMDAVTLYGPASSTTPVRQRLTWFDSPGPPRLPSVHTPVAGS